MSRDVIKITYSSRDGVFKADADYVDGSCVVKKGSQINPKAGKNLSQIVLKNREDKTIVDGDNIVLKDVTFSSASLAAQFVSGNITNGLRAWKAGKASLGTLTEGKRRKPKKED